MACYKTIDPNPRLLLGNLAAQVLPGTFEHADDHLLDHVIDLWGFDARFWNDSTSIPASYRRRPPRTIRRPRTSRASSPRGTAAFASR